MNLGPWEIIIIVLLIVLLFGARKLPELARSVGRSARIFKSEVKEMKNENSTDQPAPQQQEESFWDRPENKPAAIEQQQAHPQAQQQRNQNPQSNPQ